MTSPRWPASYPNNCTEESTNREFFFDDADHLEITFDKDSFMEMANNGTMYDYVSVKSLYREEYKLSGTSFAGKTYTVPGNYVELAFVSDNDITRKGYKCTIKPVYTEQVEQPVLLKGYSLSLSGDIGINFYMSLPYEMTNNPDQTYMNFTLPDGTQKDVYLNEAMIKTVDGEDYYVFPINVSAKDMTGKVSAKICKSGKVYDTYTYSVLDYAQYVANRPNLFNKDVLNIVSGMLNYGSAAQTYFGFKTEEMPLSPMAIYPDLKEYQYKLIDNSSIEFVGARLLLKSKPGIKFYFTGATEKTTFQLNGKAMKTTKEDGFIVVTISNIEDMRKMYTITARNFSLTYGVYSYGYSALSSSKVNEDLKNLIGAMYMYNSILYNES